ncbi:MAG: TRAP transporter substrate-binding protein DctP [Minwuia sp.]|uniref:TRAP transporter substrate-binding protein DctP n=1 Tax=Minwuia sp. TaxID=2493630 RepID=UPI003A86DFEF
MRTVTKAIAPLGIAFAMMAGATQAQAECDKVYTLKYHNAYPPTLALYNKVGAGFKERVEAWSGGCIKFENYDSGALTSVGGMVDAVDQGIIDISHSWGAFYVGDVPEADIEVGLPLAWGETYEVYDAYYNRGLKEVIAEAYESRFNVKHFPSILGLEYVLATREEISSLADLNGKKLRALGIYGEIAQSVGASAVVIPGGELYTALQLGTIDGLIYGAEAIVAQGLQEFLKTAIVEPNLNAGAAHWLFNRNTWEDLPPELQQVIEQAVDYGNLAGAMDYRIVEAMNIGVLERDGVKLLELSPADNDQLNQTALGLWDKIAERSPLAAKGVEIVKQQQRDFGQIE